MPGQLFRISDFEREGQMQARVAERRKPTEIYEFPARIPPGKKKSSARAWRRGLDIALIIELGGVLLLAAVWLIRHLLH